VSRVCEEFSCTPMVAARELEEDPEHRVLAVLELRAYARAKTAIDQAQSAADAPTGPMVEWVGTVAAEKIRRRHEGEGG